MPVQKSQWKCALPQCGRNRNEMQEEITRSQRIRIAAVVIALLLGASGGLTLGNIYGFRDLKKGFGWGALSAAFIILALAAIVKKVKVKEVEEPQDEVDARTDGRAPENETTKPADSGAEPPRSENGNSEPAPELPPPEEAPKKPASFEEKMDAILKMDIKEQNAAYAKLAKLCLGKGNVENAEKAAKKISKHLIGDPIQIAIATFWDEKREDRAKAIAAVENVKKKEKERFLHERAELYFAQGRLEEAFAFIEAIPLPSKEASDFRIKLSAAFLDQKKAERALEVLKGVNGVTKSKIAIAEFYRTEAWNAWNDNAKPNLNRAIEILQGIQLPSSEEETEIVVALCGISRLFFNHDDLDGALAATKTLMYENREEERKLLLEGAAKFYKAGDRDRASGALSLLAESTLGFMVIQQENRVLLDTVNRQCREDAVAIFSGISQNALASVDLNENRWDTKRVWQEIEQGCRAEIGSFIALAPKPEEAAGSGAMSDDEGDPRDDMKAKFEEMESGWGAFFRGLGGMFGGRGGGFGGEEDSPRSAPAGPGERGAGAAGRPEAAPKPKAAGGAGKAAPSKAAGGIPRPRTQPEFDAIIKDNGINVDTKLRVAYEVMFTNLLTDKSLFDNSRPYNEDDYQAACALSDKDFRKKYRQHMLIVHPDKAEMAFSQLCTQNPGENKEDYDARYAEGLKEARSMAGELTKLLGDAYNYLTEKRAK